MTLKIKLKKRKYVWKLPKNLRRGKKRRIAKRAAKKIKKRKYTRRAKSPVEKAVPLSRMDHFVPRATPERVQYEYWWELWNADDLKKALMDKLGRDGWELVSVNVDPMVAAAGAYRTSYPKPRLIYFFKREVNKNAA